MSNKDLGNVIAIQVAPWKHIEDGSPEGSIEIQVEGADQETKGYGVYSRHENGMAMHRIDFDFEAAAVKYATALCNDFGVKIEPYGWQVGTVHFGPDLVVDDSRAFEAFALRQNFIKDVQRYDFDHPDKAKAGQYGHYDTATARVMWDGAVAWTVAMMGHLGMSRDYLNGGDIRVVVEARTGVGKSAICGILADKLKSLGIDYDWKDEESEKNLQERPWEVVLLDLLPTKVKIVERNLVPTQVYKQMEPSRKVSDLMSNVLSEPPAEVNLDPEHLMSPVFTDARRELISDIVNLYVDEHWFQATPGTEVPEVLVANFKKGLVEHLVNAPGEIKFPTVHVSSDTEAVRQEPIRSMDDRSDIYRGGIPVGEVYYIIAEKKADIYPGPDGEQQ